MLLQTAASVAGHTSVLSGTIAEWMWLLPVLPLVGFVINGLLSLNSAHFGPRDPNTPGHHPHSEGAAEAPAISHAEEAGAAGDDHHAVKRHRWAGVTSIVGPGVLILSFVLAAMIWWQMVQAHPAAPFIQRYFSWMPVGDLQIDAAFQLDQLSMVMILVITGVGALIHIFSIGYMRDDPGYPRFFAYLNLFVFFMLVLVMGANYPVVFVGWEGVGLCSYLLIGFWFNDKANADAGKKAFVVNRIGDVGFLIAMFMLFANIGALDFVTVNARAIELGAGSALVTTICLFFFLGCTGKSAQIPLYIWLPDAMAGPTPVSALIHAATMVTAGVYLIARSAALFSLSPIASLTVAVVGAVTAIFAATIGLKQWDIKKVLAYSTISQLGYMFVGVGVGAYVSGMFHLVTHAFFKALLFLGSGSVIHAMHAAYHHTGSHEDAQDMRNMGGLKRYLPVTCALMWIATLAISGIPPFAGFFSKDEVLGSVFARAQGSTLASASWLGIPGNALLYAIYAIGLAAAFITAVYMTRMMLYTFHGPVRTGVEEEKHLHEAPLSMTGPLVILGILTVLGGWLNLPEVLTDLVPIGPSETLAKWLDPVVGSATRQVAGTATHVTASTEEMLIGAAVIIAVAGIVLAFARLKPETLTPKREAVPEHGFERIVAEKYYVDEGVEKGIVRPVYAVSRGFLWRLIDNGLIDGFFVNGSAALARGFGWVGSRIQTGNVGIYAWVFIAGVLAMLGAFTLR
ncbi:MAG TPA: NADH-quinone oxidoreductase subunit L [Gemmatimonadaceae bacterium]|jgi:NADH-quinone oxidoreductase subunit L|nr:NADH-quinone oxidoreductase subunit L [Gemmatimonadaceae bacterium]